MSAKLYFSNSPSILLEKLSQNLNWSDPFQSPHIATPTPAMKRWIQMRLAEKRGVLANVDFQRLEMMLWQRLETLDTEHRVAFRKPAKLLDEQGLQLLILGLLQTHPPEAAQEYLQHFGFDSGSQRLYAQRLCQLSQKLAGFFREYEYSRVREHGQNGLAYAWKHGEDCFLPNLKRGARHSLHKQVAALERWQREIYHELFRTQGLRDSLGEKQGQYQYTLPQYAEMVLDQPAPDRMPDRKPPSYHLFGLSQVSSFHRSLIQRLADGRICHDREADFYIYSLNPCAEYWEDVLTPRENRRQQENLFRNQKYSDWRKLEEPEKHTLRLSKSALQAEELPEDLPNSDLTSETEEHPLLSQWGKPGRENIRLWCQITEYDFFEHFRYSQKSTVLGSIQNAILHRRGPLPEAERMIQDDSLQIFACPEIHREVETVHHSIIHALLQDPTLRPDDIAVLVPKMQDYRHVLAAVFGKQEPGARGQVPFTFADASASLESEYARGVTQLFDLAQGRFSRRDLFNLAANPCFKNSPGVEVGALKTFSEWTSKLNIFHGYDEEDRSQRGYVPDALHTWGHGLERLILGTVMEAPEPGDTRHFENKVPLADGKSGDRDLLQGFLTNVESLHRDLSPFRENRTRPWAEWLQIMADIFERYLTFPPDQKLEGFVQADLRRYLISLASMDDLESLRPNSDATSTEVAATIPMSLIQSHLENLKAGKEPFLSGGVNVSVLAALRSLPFKYVYILGLGEGRFPEDDEASTLDLRQYRRVIGEVNPSSRNRYIFLETLMCTETKLCLSYISRDIQQGKNFQMGSVLNELVDYLNACVLGQIPFQATSIPLLSRDGVLFKQDSLAPWNPPPNPFRQEKLLAWLELGKKRFPNFSTLFRSDAPASIAAEIFPTLPIEVRTEVRAEKVLELQAMPLDDARIYLENPVQYTLQKRLGIRDYVEEDPMDLEDEPFTCPFPMDLNLLQNMVMRRFQAWESTTSQDCLAHFRSEYDNMTLRGYMPEGYFRDLDKQVLLEKAEGILATLEDVFASMRQGSLSQICQAGIHIGEGTGRGASLSTRVKPDLQVPAILLRAGNKNVAIQGTLPCLFRCPETGGCGTVVFMSGSFKRKHLLPAFLFYLSGLLSETDLGRWLQSGPFTIYYVFKKEKTNGYTQGNWAPFQIGPEKARAYLVRLLESMLGEMDFDLLPFELIAKHLAGKNQLTSMLDYTETLRDALDALEENPGNFPEFTLSESMKFLEPQVPEDAEAKIRSRLELFFNFLPDAEDVGPIHAEN